MRSAWLADAQRAMLEEALTTPARSPRHGVTVAAPDSLCRVWVNTRPELALPIGE